MNRNALALALLAVALAVPAFAQQSIPFTGQRIVTVMTRNLYHGVDAELGAATAAENLQDLLQKSADVYQGYFARNPHQRMAALAVEIEASMPDLIGLQEAVLVRTQLPADGPVTPATTVALDMTEILLEALAARGLSYQLAVESIGLDIEGPSALGFDVRHTDRVAILARADLKPSELKLSNPQSGNFSVNCQIPSPFLGTITILRGWASVDVKIRGKSFRFINTHLDGDCLPFTSFVQQAQALELLAEPADTDLPILLAGDLNSPGDGTGVTYNLIRSAGFLDAWLEAGLGGAPTCCQDDDLLNPVSKLDRRIDFVLYRGEFEVWLEDIFGEDPADRTSSGLWPSDHAGIAATVRLPHP